MKRFFGYLLLASLALTTVISCRSSKNSTGILGKGSGIGSTVMTVVGAIVLAKIVQAVLKTVSSSASFNSFSGDKKPFENFDENTKLSSLAQNDLMKTALQVLVAERFQIPLKTVVSNYSNFNTLGDLSTFIGKNANASVLSEFK
ncbi:MAG: hypothetical protein WAT19_06760 [Ferruginibacter sp.]